MLLPTPPLPLITTSLWRTAAIRPLTAFICSVICWTTLASSAYFSRPRMSFRSFVAMARRPSKCAPNLAWGLKWCQFFLRGQERVLPPHSSAQLGVSPSRPRRPGCTPRAASGRPCGVTRLRLNNLDHVLLHQHSIGGQRLAEGHLRVAGVGHVAVLQAIVGDLLPAPGMPHLGDLSP